MTELEQFIFDLRMEDPSVDEGPSDELIEKYLVEWAKRKTAPLEAEALRLVAALEQITHNGWYLNGYVPAGDEQVRLGILMDRVNAVQARSEEALASAPLSREIFNNKEK